MIDASKEKLCTKCQLVKSLDLFRMRGSKKGYRSHCRDCERLAFNHYNESHREERRIYGRVVLKQRRSERRPKNVRKNPGYTQQRKESYATLFKKQNGVCAICGKPETAKHQGGTIKSLAIDHDHITGKIRGLLCFRCNTNLAILEDKNFVESAMNYLKQHNG